ncbi:MAG: hypothetical protein M5U19_02790 [Microthrixaceae bacterium]|nr:hypothetical protein [Microthrixaceae bacterium]
MCIGGLSRAPRTGDMIRGLEAAEEIEGVEVFVAGVSGEPGNLRTGGGRVLDVTGRAPTIGAARVLAMQGVAAVSWPGMQYRTDIAAIAATEGS